MKRVVEEVRDLTPAWLSEALGAPVTAVDVAPIGMGRMGATYRIGVQGAGERASVVVKMASGDLAARQRVALGFQKEIGFYRELAATVDVRVPHVLHAALSDDATTFTLVMEDLATFNAGVQVDGCTPREAAAALENLAALHAPSWNNDELRTHSWLTPIDETMVAFIADMFGQATETFLDWYEHELDAQDQGTLRDVRDAISAWHIARPTPFALLHGDYRIDNLMFSTVDDTVVAVDWQGTTIGPPARDVAYFLATGLHTEARRSEERTLVAGYHDAIAKRGVDHYTFEQCFDDYRLGQLHVPWITVLGATAATAGRSSATDEMFVSMITRSCAAIRDLDSLGLL